MIKIRKIICKNCGEPLDYWQNCNRWFREEPTAWSCDICGYMTEEEENPKIIFTNKKRKYKY